MPRRISSESRKPAEVSRPTLAPFFSRMVLVATVEPCTNRAQSPSRAETGRSSCWAARRSTPRTPSLGSAGTAGDLKMRTAPAASRSTMSVKVPPTSTPMRQGATREGRGAVIGGAELSGPSAMPPSGFRWLFRSLLGARTSGPHHERTGGPRSKSVHRRQLEPRQRLLVGIGATVVDHGLGPLMQTHVFLLDHLAVGYLAFGRARGLGSLR